MGFLTRLVLGLIMYSIGLFWAMIAFPMFLLMSLRHGVKGVRSIFKRGNHDILPEIVRSPKYNHDYVTTKSGMKFHYVHTGSNDKPLMLCLHGFPECWYSWRHILEQFSDDYYVVAIDLRGYGGSDKPKSIGEYHITYLVRDVYEIVYALGYSKCVLVAHDWGGVIGWNVPHFYENLVEKLIILNAPHGQAFREFGLKFPSQILKSWYIFYFQIPFLADFHLKSDDCRLLKSAFNGKKSGIKNKKNQMTEEQISVYKHYVAPNLSNAINFYRAGNPLYTGLDMKIKTKIIKCPTLVIWGDKDDALDHRMVPFFEKYVSNLQVEMIYGAGHWVGLDEPVQVEAAMRRFL